MPNVALRLIFILTSVCGFEGAGFAAIPNAIESAPCGTVSVLVEQEDGSEAPDANIYIERGERRGNLIEVKGKSNGVFLLPAGTYRISAGLIKPLADTVDHYATPQALVHLTDGDNTSVILRLHLSQDIADNLTESHLKKMGLDPSLPEAYN